MAVVGGKGVGLFFEVGFGYGAAAPADGTTAAAASESWREARGAGGSLSGFYLYLKDVHQVESLGQIGRRLCAIVAKVLVGLAVGRWQKTS